MGAGTFSQIYIQVVFAVKNRQSLIQPDWEVKLYQYIAGIMRNMDQKLLAINGMPDHVHLLVGLRPSCRLSDLVREIKKSSNAWINEKGFSKYKFEWQEGYGAFSYGHSSLYDVIKYIGRQKEHHMKKTFQEEYLEFLKKYEVPYKQEYLFKKV